MNHAKVHEASQTELTVEGDLSFDSVLHLLEPGQAFIRQNNETTVDLSGVQSSDSAGLALLLSWYRVATQHNKRIYFKNQPQSLTQLASICGVKTLLFQ